MITTKQWIKAIDKQIKHFLKGRFCNCPLCRAIPDKFMSCNECIITERAQVISFHGYTCVSYLQSEDINKFTETNLVIERLIALKSALEMEVE